MANDKFQKSIVLDSGPVISLTTSNLLNLLDIYTKKYGFEFIITPFVKNELVDEPLTTKRFEYEALLVMNEIKKKNLTIAKQTKELSNKTKELLHIANSIILVNGNPISIIHSAEIEVIAYCLLNKIGLVCIDERSMRLLIEDADLLAKIIGKRLHKKTSIDKAKAEQFKEITKDIKIIRSSELVIKAFEHKLLDLDINVKKSEILKAMLWSLKLHGCTISEKEINQIIKA